MQVSGEMHQREKILPRIKKKKKCDVPHFLWKSISKPHKFFILEPGYEFTYGINSRDHILFVEIKFTGIILNK